MKRDYLDLKGALLWIFGILGLFAMLWVLLSVVAYHQERQRLCYEAGGTMPKFECVKKIDIDY